MLYGLRVFRCLPVGMGDPGSAQTGAVMRTDTFLRYAADIGFTSAEVLQIKHESFFLSQ